MEFWVSAIAVAIAITALVAYLARIAGTLEDISHQLHHVRALLMEAAPRLPTASPPKQPPTGEQF